ncbi:MAG: lipoprotein [Nitrosomonadaceae bacterium]
MRTLCTAVLLILMLEACGLKGPLYLPQDPPSELQKSQVEG